MARTRTTKEATKRELPRRVPPLTVPRAFGSKSPLVDLDLQAFLARCVSADQWQNYTEEEKTRILESLPQLRRNTSRNSAGTLPKDESLQQIRESNRTTASPSPTKQNNSTNIPSDPPLDSSDLVTDPFVKRAIARFKRDLGDGYYEKTWQDKAKRAHKERMDGRFDEYVLQLAEDKFGEPAEGDDVDGQDELAQISEDGEYLDTSKGRGEGAGRPRKAKRGQ